MEIWPNDNNKKPRNNEVLIENTDPLSFCWTEYQRDSPRVESLTVGAELEFILEDLGIRR